MKTKNRKVSCAIRERKGIANFSTEWEKKGVS